MKKLERAFYGHAYNFVDRKYFNITSFDDYNAGVSSIKRSAKMMFRIKDGDLKLFLLIECFGIRQRIYEEN